MYLMYRTNSWLADLIVAFSKSIARAFCALCLLLFAYSAPANAQAPIPSAVALTKINVLSQSDRETHLQLVVEPKYNGFQALSNNPRDPTIALALTTRTSSAVTPRELRGFVRGIDFVQAEGVLVLHFLVDKGATVVAVPSGDKTIEVTIGAIDRPSERVAAGDQASSPLPPALEPSPGQDSYALVLLKYADVSEVVGLLSQGAAVKSNDVFVPREPGFGSGSLTGNSYQPQPATTQAPGSSDEPLGQSVDASMAIDRRLNAVWLRGSPDYIARMKEMIATIDIPVDSVILETEMVELTETGSKALGIDFANANGQIGVITYQRGQFIPPGIPAGDHLISASFQAALYAQVSKGNGRILSKPRIAAQSGSTAKIITGDALPILTAITLSGVNGVQQQVQYVNVGVTLQIAPRVSNDGFVSSHIYCVVSSVTGFSQGYPTISQRQAETAATVRDGDSFVIGGLTQDENITTKTKVPLLGDIPILGQAFRTDRNTRTKTELYIVVTPHIVHHMGPRSVATNQPVYAPTTVTTVNPETATPQPR
jgi:general secretion pathway protein D